MDRIKESEFSARLGQTVVVWMNGTPSFETIPCVAQVIGVGLNGRLDLFVIYTGPLQNKGGGRPWAHIHGVYPPDSEATAGQLEDSGTWMHLQDYWDAMDDLAKKKAEDDERERRKKANELAAKEKGNKPAPPPSPPPADPLLTTPAPLQPDPVVKSGGRKMQPAGE